jgi:hypothetical protein
MARIPSLGTRSRVSVDVPRTQTTPISQAGLVEGAQAKLTKQVTNFATNLAKKREQAQIQDTVDTSFRNYNSRRIDLELGLKDKYSSNPDGYAQEYATEEQNLRNELEGGINNSEALKKFKSMTLGPSTRATTNASNYENLQRSKFQLRAFKERESSLLTDAAVDPDVHNTNEYLKHHLNSLDEAVGLHFSEESKNIMAESARRGVRRTVFNSMLEKGTPIIDKDLPKETQLKQVEQLLDGSDPRMGEILEGMGPKEREGYYRRFKNQIEMDRRVEDRGIKEDALKAISLLEKGAPLNPELEREIDEVASKIPNMENDRDKFNLGSRLMNAREVNAYKKSIVNLNSNDVVEQVKENSKALESGDLGEGESEARLKRSMVKAAIQDLEDRERDGNAYVKLRLPHKDSSIPDNVKTQKELGIRNWRVLSKGDAKLEKAAFDELLTAEEKTQRLIDLESRTGREHLKKAVDEMGMDGNIKLASIVPNKQSKKELIELSMNKDGIAKDYKAKGGSVEGLDRKIGKKAEDFLKTFRHSQNLNEAEQVLDSLKLKAMSDFEGREDKAVDSAVQSIVHDNFHTFEGDRDMFFSKAIHNRETIVEWAEAVKTPKGLKAAGFRPPQGWGLQGKSEEEFYEIAADRLIIVNNKGQTGIQLMVFDDSLGREVPLLGEDGRPREVLFRQMSSDLDSGEFGDLPYRSRDLR